MLQHPKDLHEEGHMRSLLLLLMIEVGVTSEMAVACDQLSDSLSAHAAPAAAPAHASAAPSGSAPAKPTLWAHMAEHFSRTASVKKAVIAGDLQASKEDAEWMAKHDFSVPDSWRPHVQAMQAAAQRVVDATDTATAARATADMGQVCGSCHRTHGGPKFEVGSPPAEGSGAATQMLRHQWAADRMWEGLIGPSEAAWVKGSEALGGAILIKKGLEKSVPPEVESLARKIHDLGEKSRSAAPGDRAALYGEFLGTCAECHSKLGARKKK
jgi:hypothetical protein